MMESLIEGWREAADTEGRQGTVQSLAFADALRMCADQLEESVRAAEQPWFQQSTIIMGGERY